MGTLILAGQQLPADLLDQYYGFADTTQTTVNTTGPASLSTAYVIPANEPVAGSAYEIRCGGGGTWGSTAQYLTLSLWLGGQEIFSNVTVSFAAFSANAGFRWRAQATLVCAVSGSGGEWYGDMEWTLTQIANQVNPGTAADNTVSVADADGSEVGVDTTSNMTAVIKAGWASATGSPAITCFHTVFRKIS
jgi:hypothetical protein